MAIYTERNAISILDAAVDPEGDPLSVTEVNGDAALIGAPVALSIGGSITVGADGVVIFDDTGFTWPGFGNSVFDGVIATVSDGSNNVSVAVNVQINHI